MAVKEPTRVTFNQRARTEQLVDVAIELIGEGGLAAASNVAIARRAGISRGVLNYNVGDRDTLIALVVARAYAVGGALVDPPVTAAPDPAAALRAFVTASLDFYLARPAEMRALREVFADPALVERTTTAEHQGELARLTRLVREGQALGLLSAGEPALLVSQVRAALDWGALALGSGAALEDVRREVLAVVDRVLSAG